MVDQIDHRGESNPKLWLAPGAYELPQNTGYHAKIVFLHDDMYLQGRTADFRQSAMGKERALLIGTASWNDYRGHTGANGYVYNIRMKTDDNPVLVEDFKANLNIHSTGGLHIENVELLKTNGENSLNIKAQYTSVYKSHLLIEGKSVTNIDADTVYLFSSDLSSKGSNPENIHINNGFLYVVNSNLFTQAGSCDASAISADRPVKFLVEGSKINMVATTNCSGNEAPISGVTAWADEKNLSPIEVNSSEINIHTLHASALAFSVYGIALNMQNLKVKIDSEEGDIYGFNAKDIFFQGLPSFIEINSSNQASLYVYPDFIQINNESAPKSHCIINTVDMVC